jgi:hypothetical protein
MSQVNPTSRPDQLSSSDQNSPTGNNLEDHRQTPNDTRTVEAKRLDELALQYRKSRDPAIVAAMRALARRLSDKNQ